MRPLYASAASSGFPNQPNASGPSEYRDHLRHQCSLRKRTIDGTGEKVAVIGQVDVYFARSSMTFARASDFSPITSGTTNAR